MSTATISYSSLKDASSEANSVAKKLFEYSDNLNSRVYNKLNNYSGSYTEDIETAKSMINSKTNELRSKATAYSNYASDLINLKDECTNTDKSVKTMVSQLTASFKQANGIKNSKIQNTINYFLTSFKNSTSAGRWLNNTSDKVDTVKDYIKQSLEDWWDYEGGKELVKGVLVGVLEVAIAVCVVVGAILSGAALIVIIAGAIAGVIALANGVANIWNETKAYNATQNDDPALGRRRSEVNTWQDYLRSSFLYGDDGEKYQYSKGWNYLATGIDVVNLVCTAITLVNSAGSLIKNAYKWTTGSMADAKNLRVKDILTKDNFSQLFVKIKGSMGKGIKDISTAFRSGNFERIGEFLFDFGDDFMNNLKKGYTLDNLKYDTKTIDYIKDGAKLVKNYSGIAKSLVKDGLSIENIVVNIGLKTLFLPNINTVDIVTYKPGDRGGVFNYDISSIKVTDMLDIFKNSKSIVGNDIFKDNTTIGKNLLDKLSTKCNVSINIPDISIPSIDMNFKNLSFAA